VTSSFDLIVIGGGSGGLAHAQRAAEYGATVAVIESGPLGGTCVNVGCVPKKIMWYVAHHAHALEHARDFGFDISVKSHDWSGVRKKRDAYILRLNEIYRKNLDHRDVTLFEGQAKFLDEKTVEVAGQPYSANRFVIATGGYPIIPGIQGSEHGITSDGFFQLPDRPQRVALVGSGYVAVELAGVFNGLGSETTVLVRKDGVVRSFDAMLGQELERAMISSGTAVEKGVVPRELTRSVSGIRLHAEDGREFGDYDAVIWAVGRAPNTESLALQAAGVKIDDAGFVPVDKWQKTNVDHIFAIGDVTGRAALTPVAIAAGRRLADRLYGGMSGRRLEYDWIPTVIFTHPPIGTTGLTTEQAHDKFGADVRVYETRFNPMLYAFSDSKMPTTMKLITAGADERIVGCHIIGDGADEMLQGFAVAIRMGATKKQFDDTVAIHPTSAEELVTMR